MSQSSDDTIGCVAFAAALAFGGWWLFNHYEVVEKKDAPAALMSDPNPVTARALLPATMYLTTTKTGTDYILDTRSVKGPRTARLGWVSLDFSKDRTQQARTGKELIWTNCETGEVKSLSYVGYDKDGKVLYSDDTAVKDAKVDYYPPGTVGSIAPSRICEKTFD